MPYNEKIATLVRSLLAGRRAFVQKRLFGGVGFLIDGHLAVAVWREFLIVRVGPEDYAEALREPGVRKFDVTGRAMRGWVMIEADVVSSPASLRGWVQRAVEFVRSLPPKPGPLKPGPSKPEPM